MSVGFDRPVVRGRRMRDGMITGATAVVLPLSRSAQLVAADCSDFGEHHEYSG